MAYTNTVPSISTEYHTLRYQSPISDQVSQVTTLPEGDPSEPKFVISVDYGTTYTGVAWTLTTGQPPTLRDVVPVMNWPGAKTDAKVPSTYTYSANMGSQCWGHGIGNNALVIRLTKLHIEPPNLSGALEDLKQTISEAAQLAFSPNQEGGLARIPRHLIRTNEDVMTDYLTEVLSFARLDIEKVRDPVTLSQNPIDLVITHPAEWAPRAKNITFRAVTTAFRNSFSDIDYELRNIRLASEPEACAQYIMRESLETRRTNLRPGECFIVVDAGGGTVDLAAYRVLEVQPTFRVTRVGDVIGKRFGSTEIDKCFLQEFLPSRLSPSDYAKLMQIGGARDQHGTGSHIVLREGEQLMLSRFLPIKHKFRGVSAMDGEIPPPDRLPLPNGIGTVDTPDRTIVDGDLLITHDDMVQMFKYSVEGTKDLISQQLIQLDGLKLKVRTIFLSGGFSRNFYYQQSINLLARQWRFSLLSGSDSWTAVSKGAVLMGLGIGCEVPPRNIPCPMHIGVVVSSRFRPYENDEDQRYTDSFSKLDRAREHIHWVVKRHDLVTPTEGIRASVKIVRKFYSGGNKSGLVTIVLSQSDDPSSLDHRLVKNGINAHHTVDLRYDLGNLPQHEASALIMNVTNPKTGQTYKHVEMSVEVVVSQVGASLELVCGKKTDMLGNVTLSGNLLASKAISFS